MKIKAAIFDVYGTLLEVGAAPPDAEERWGALWREMLQIDPRLSRLEFSVACNRAVHLQHTIARARGIAVPEVNWPSIVTSIIPEVSRLSPDVQQEFFWRQIRTGHTTRLANDTVAVLAKLRTDRCRLGIASNAQSYTLRELRENLACHNIQMAIFDPELCFWSFQHGFSKPDPHVFQILSTRLEAIGVAPNEVIMVGDRLDNDIEPARSHGWQAWHLSSPGTQGDGTMHALWEFLLCPSRRPKLDHILL